MPEFHIGTGSPEGATAYGELDSFTQGYVEAMFFTSAGTGDDAENGLESASFAEMAPSAVERIKEWCAKFQKENQRSLDLAYDYCPDEYDAERAGNDFLYSRCGHGTGFWDRRLGAVGDVLHKAAQACGASYLYRGDDGLLYTDLG